MKPAAKLSISPALESAVYRSWCYIAQDAMELAAECGERLTNGGAVESAIDANRLTSCAFAPEAEKELEALIEAYGYTKVFKALCRACKLV